MASSKTTAETPPVDELAPADGDEDSEQASAGADPSAEDLALESVDDDDAAKDDAWSESDDDESDSAGDAEETKDLDELESEELEMLTEDELAETLVVDEAAELAAIRRAELAMDVDSSSERGAGEFLCQGCFLVLSTTQLADKRRMLCSDCAG